jgi:3-oxoacyl-[acyl-carrier protein] reductase
LVTGAASGLGKAIAMGLAREGAQVVALDVNEAGLQLLEDEARCAGIELSSVLADVTKEESVVAAVRQAVERVGGLNALVNNAGIYRDGLLVKKDARTGRILKMPRAQWQVVIDTDLTGPWLLAREVVAQMLERDIKPGLIINISSVSRAGVPGQSNYAAAKAGVVADTRAWAEELAPNGIRVAAIAPGFFQTPILEAMRPEVLQAWIDRIPLKRLGDPAEFVSAVKFVVDCDYFTGRCLDVDGGLHV